MANSPMLPHGRGHSKKIFSTSKSDLVDNTHCTGVLSERGCLFLYQNHWCLSSFAKPRVSENERSEMDETYLVQNRFKDLVNFVIALEAAVLLIKY